MGSGRGSIVTAMARLPGYRRRPLRAIDLFCGAGGLTEGFKAAGYEVSFALDRDKDSCATYKRNHPEVDVECGLITDISPDEIAARAGVVDVVIGGPSCQTFSTHGRMHGWVPDGDDRNELWEHMLAVVDRLNPHAFLIENVPGMVYWQNGHMGKAILDGFEALGYDVSKEILLAADYGVPQRRRRLFIVGVRGRRKFHFPEQTHMGGWRRDTLELWEKERKTQGLLRHLTVWDAIGDLPPIEDTGSSVGVYPKARLTAYARAMRFGSKSLNDHEINLLPDEHRKLVHHVPQGGTWRDIPPHLLPDRFRGMRRTDGSNLLGRLDPQLPSYTITTQFNNVTTGCNTHPYADRSLSVREGARLQSFPDRYGFEGSVTSRCRQIGNAVPPLLARMLARQLAVAIQGQAAADEFHPAPRRIHPAKQLPAPPATDATTRARMKKQPRTNTKPETQLRKQLHAAGLRYRINEKPLEGLRRTADIVFTSRRLAVFVDGCFWHGCPEHARDTKSNTKWWAKKISANKERDVDTTLQLEGAGWTVMRIWEHEDPVDAAERVIAAFRAATERPQRRAA
jgi:DNA (cytosine-5)-methyltransferase 1